MNTNPIIKTKQPHLPINIRMNKDSQTSHEKSEKDKEKKIK